MVAAAAARVAAGGGRGAGRSRTVVLMDATRSMNHLMQKAKAAVGTMFDRASQVPPEKAVCVGCVCVGSRH